MPFPTHSAARMNARRLGVALYDVAVWFVATIAMTGARYDFALKRVQWEAALGYALWASLLMLALGYASGLYRGHFRWGSFTEAFRLGAAALVITIAVGLGFIFLVDDFPAGLAASVPPLALLLMAAARWLIRALSDNPVAIEPEDAAPALIYGAGVIGGQIAQSVRTSTDTEFKIVGFLDDDPWKRNLRLEGSRVLGTGADLEVVALQTGATTVILSITTANQRFVRSLTARTDAAGLRLLIVPRVDEIMRSGSPVNLSQLHEVKVEDLLGRRPIHTDLGAIADYLSNKVVLITGAGGIDRFRAGPPGAQVRAEGARFAGPGRVRPPLRATLRLRPRSPRHTGHRARGHPRIGRAR